MQFDSASFLPDLGLIANQKKLCQSIFQNARFLESGNQNANMATLLWPRAADVGPPIANCRKSFETPENKEAGNLNA